MNELKSRMIELGGNEWTKNEMERVYINNDILNVFRDEQEKPPVCFGEKNNKIFFDVKTNSIMRSYKNKKPTIEIQF